MLDLHSAFADFAPDTDVNEPAIDRDFITAFLLPYFSDLPREQLAAKLEEIIALEHDKSAPGPSRRKTVANPSHTN